MSSLELLSRGRVEEAPALRENTVRVLLAEDDEPLRGLLGAALREDGYEVEEAIDGDTFLIRLESSLERIARGGLPEFDLIISDVRMPGLSGLDVLSILRSMDGLTPFILITGFADEEMRDRALGNGASAVIDKPFDVEMFREVLRQLVPPA